MHLHEDREQFADAVRKSVQYTNMSEIYKDDYWNLTEALLEGDVSYETAIQR